MHFVFTNGVGKLKHSVSKCRLAMIHVGNNGEIPNVLLLHRRIIVEVV